MVFDTIDNKSVSVFASAIVGACKTGDWAEPVQPAFLNALFSALFGFDGDFHTLEPSTIDDAKAAVPLAEARVDLVELMLIVELLAHPPIPRELSASVAHWARELGVDNADTAVTLELAQSRYKVAQADLYRRGYWGGMAQGHQEFLEQIERYGTSAYATTVEPDPAEVARWQHLEHCPSGSLGRAVYRFYVDNEFEFPGTVGAANLITAQHDWIHVLADYPPTGPGECAVGAFRMTSTSLPGARLGFLAELAFWQSATVESKISGWHRGVFALEEPGATQLVADAMRRGQVCNQDFYADFDFWQFKDEQLNDLRSRWII